MIKEADKQITNYKAQITNVDEGYYKAQITKHKSQIGTKVTEMHRLKMCRELRIRIFVICNL